MTGLLLLSSMLFYTAGIRAVYGNKWIGWGGNNLRFGEQADWRVKPILLNKRHN